MTAMTRKVAATLLSAAALAVIPVTPVAQADVCGDVGGPYVRVGGCTDVALDLAAPAVVGAEVAAADEWARYGFPVGYPYSLVPAFPGEAPCISPTGLRYYTPGTAPCYLP
jgi:hypothetical protein